MTIIIGALLDDGRRIIKADGRGVKGIVVTENSAVKTVRIENRVSKRVAAFGIAGTAALKHVFEEVLTRMVAAPGALAEDLSLRLHERFHALGMDHDMEAVVWFDDKLYTVDCALHVKEEVDHAFAFAGSGADHAQGALLGLGALRDPQWKPHMHDVDTAYDVAVACCTNCGGRSTLIVV